ncbi:hypothetical protein KAR91_84550 [Candidatus Pacearchaeota archaeon]|nr:hypothetical protein [Candidatus Pacearchaeota archaeon]
MDKTKELKENCRQILKNASVPSARITTFLGSDGKVQPLTQTLSFKRLMDVYKTGGDLKKIFKFAEIEQNR